MRRFIPILILLVALVAGIVFVLPAFRSSSATAVHVTMQELQANSTTYLNQFVEMRGTLRFIGLQECSGLGFELSELAPHHDSFMTNPHMRYDQLPLEPVRVWGTIRKAQNNCGPDGPPYLDITHIELLPTPTAQ